MKRSSFGIERRLARTNKHALYVADFIGLDETELVLLIPWVDDPAFCRHRDLPSYSASLSTCTFILAAYECCPHALIHPSRGSTNFGEYFF
jgi:hypothetical protein